MVDEVELPDVPQFVADWLDSVKAGTRLADTRIHAYETPPHDSPPFVVLDDAGALRDRGVPAYLPYRLSLTATARTETEAAALYRAVTGILHDAKNVLVGDVGFWGAFDETGPQPRNDPGTRWPARFGIVDIYMPDRSLGAEGS
jgi:hypothetical protein